MIDNRLWLVFRLEEDATGCVINWELRKATKRWWGDGVDSVLAAGVGAITAEGDSLRIAYGPISSSLLNPSTVQSNANAEHKVCSQILISDLPSSLVLLLLEQKWPV